MTSCCLPVLMPDKTNSTNCDVTMSCRRKLHQPSCQANKTELCSRVLQTEPSEVQDLADRDHTPVFALTLSVKISGRGAETVVKVSSFPSKNADAL